MFLLELKYKNFRAQKLSRAETFAHINFRGFQKSAKVYAREIFKIGRTAKVYERENFGNMQPRKLMSNFLYGGGDGGEQPGWGVPPFLP